MDDFLIPDHNLRWTAWRVSCGQEFVVAEWAENWFTNVITPSIKVRVCGTGEHAKYIDRPLIGGYVCVGAADGESVLSWSRLGTQVFQFIDVPKSATRQFCHELSDMCRVAASDPYSVTRSQLKSGDPVRITDGPLMGIEGVVHAVSDHKFEIIVAIHMFNTGALVNVDAGKVEYIGHPERSRARRQAAVA